MNSVIDFLVGFAIGVLIGLSIIFLFPDALARFWIKIDKVIYRR